MADVAATWLKRIVKGGAGCIPVVGGLLAEGADAWFEHLEDKPDITDIERQLRAVIVRMKTLEGNQNALLEGLGGCEIDENFQTPMQDLCDALANPDAPPARIRKIIEKIQSRDVSFEAFDEQYRVKFASLLPDVWNMPHRRNPNFTGRGEILESLRKSLVSGAPTALTQAIAGLGGVGKTQLAIEYAYRYADEYDVLWWIQSETPAERSGDYASLAKPLGLSDGEVADQEAAVNAVRQTLEHKDNWLLIFDNASDPGSIQRYLPRGKTGHIIITSRHQAWGGVAEPVSVQVLPEGEAIAFLLKRSGRDDRDAAGRLAEMLGCLPLALEQAGAYIESTGCSIDDYIEFFKQNHKALLARESANADYPDSVATTWEISFRELGETAADLLNLCAFLAPDNIPLEMLAAGAAKLPNSLASVVSNKMTLRECIAELLGFSLVESTADAISVHRIVQAVVRDRLDSDRRKTLAASVVETIDAQFPRGDVSSDPDCWQTCRRLLPHALAATEHAEAADASPEATGRLLNQSGLYLQIRAEFLQAKGCIERALKIDEAVYGSDHPEVATDVNNLGNVLQDLGELEGAKECFERALRIGEETLDPGHPKIAIRVNNLGNVLLALGDLEGAKKCHEHALRIDEAVHGTDHPAVARDVNNLGSVLQAIGDLEGAKKCIERALKIAEAAYGTDHPEVMTYANNLGSVLQELGDLEGARKYFEHALKIGEETLGPNHTRVATSVSNLGMLLQTLGDLDGAKKCIERALKIDEAAYGPDHPNVAIDVNNLGFLLKTLGDLEGAKEYYERALKIDEAAYGADHPKVAIRVNNLGGVLFAEGDIRGALEHAERALQIWESRLGPDHPTTQQSRKVVESMRKQL